MNSDQVRILFTIPNFITAGSGRALLNIVERLDRGRFAPTICVSRSGGSPEEDVERLGIPLIEHPFSIPAKPYGSLIQRLRAAAEAFRPYRFDVWHSFHYLDDYTEPLIARLSGAKRWVFTKKSMSWGSRAWHLRSLLASRIAAQNTDMLERFFAGWPLSGKVRLVPRGVDTEKFRPMRGRGSELRDTLNISSSAVLAGCVAHLVPVKGHPTALRAVAGVPNLHLLIAGKPLDHRYSEQLRSLASQLGIQDRVTFLGNIEDVPGLLSELDIAVLPTWARWRMEGCPVALLEAMSAGLACVATDIPGSRDLIQHGSSGVLVAPEDHESLAAALDELSRSRDLRERLGTGARKRVLDYYTIDREVRDHVTLYDEVLNGR